MTDHELCLAAAKAAGYTITSEQVGWYHCTAPNLPNRIWNPIKSDMDAFRLMVDCALEVAVAPGFTDVEGLGETAVIRTSEEHGTNKHAATRRAIVRAAAAMVYAESP